MEAVKAFFRTVGVAVITLAVAYVAVMLLAALRAIVVYGSIHCWCCGDPWIKLTHPLEHHSAFLWLWR